MTKTRRLLAAQLPSSTAILAAATFSAAALLLAPAPAEAQAVCEKRATMLKNLDAKYQEKRHALGIQTNGSVVEVYASERGSFSIVVTLPDGQSCIVMAGDDWQEYEVQPTDVGLKGA